MSGNARDARAQPEQWLPVVGWEGIYEVSDHGRIRSLERVVQRTDGKRQAVPTRIRKTPSDDKGRPIVHLAHEGRSANYRVALLVLEAFVGPRPAGLQCCHNDGDPANNHPGNLRWDTPAANSQDSIRHGTHSSVRKTHCPAGHLLAGEHLAIRTSARGTVVRHCKTCSNERLRDYKRKLRAARKAAM